MSDVGSEGGSETSEIKNLEPKLAVRWIIPNRLDAISFVGRDVLGIAHDVYITFLNFKNFSELVYVANNTTNGDGVDVFTGHRSNYFAFSEKVNQGRIFIVSYPAFNVVAELKDTSVNRYKGLCMMECDLVAGFSGFPKYQMSIWSWRTNQRLYAVQTGVVRRHQMFMASRSHMMICQCWGQGLILWEVAQCYKKTLVMRRAKDEVAGWEVSDPPHVGICWSNDGQLYTIDPNANLYSVLSDGIGMVTNLEWSEDISGSFSPCICSFANGLLIYGPDKNIRSLKKCDQKWKVVWSQSMEDAVVRMVSNSTSDVVGVWTESGFVYRVTADHEDKPEMKLFTYKQRNIQRIQLIAPNYEYLATMNDKGVLCIYDARTAQLVQMQHVEGNDISFQASPVDPLLIVFGEVGNNYGMVLMKFDLKTGLRRLTNVCLTHQIVSQVVFSPTGREVVAAAMSAGHIFIYRLSKSYQLELVRYSELGRGIADCFLMKVGDAMRVFSLVLFSDKYPIGERVICINTETGKDNKFAGKMQGPYAKLLPLKTKDTMLGIPHLSKQYHILKLSGDKGITVTVKMGPIIDTGHEMKYYYGFNNLDALLTYSADGTIIVRAPDAPEEYDFRFTMTHRYDAGFKQALIDDTNSLIVHLGHNHTVAVVRRAVDEIEAPKHEPPKPDLFISTNKLNIISESDKNYLDIQEDKKIKEEAIDHKAERDAVVKTFDIIQKDLVDLLEENLTEPPLHQLSLSEFNLHQEHKKERLKQAEREREEIRLKTEARIRAQDKVTSWIKQQCWDTMLSPRVKIFAIFSHYQVENFTVLPTQRDNWPELHQIEALRTLEMEKGTNVFRPWEETSPDVEVNRSSRVMKANASVLEVHKSMESQLMVQPAEDEEEQEGSPYVLSGTNTHKFVPVPRYMIPQAHAFSFLQMNWLHHIAKLNVQNMRLWFNKQFDELMNQKKREVGLVEERNARLRFIVDELNKLSDLRGSFHHLVIQIKDPEWRQEEQPHRLIKVEPGECSIEPYISPSQIVIVPPDPGPKDDFRERALIEMMDGVLEKLWHEEIKKPIPMPQCMLEKDPEHFNEDDLRLVFDYEAKVAFRNEERDKYRKLLHAEYAKLSQILNEGIVKFNQRVKELWLMKLRVDSVIGQESLNLMRMRRVNLDRVEMAEKLEGIRHQIVKYELETEELNKELKTVQEQGEECQAMYDNLSLKDKYLDRTFKNHFADLSPIIVDQCYKFFRKRPKWQQRATLTPAVLYELAAVAGGAARPAFLHHDCLDYIKGLEQLDLISNMPPVMDEQLWATMCKLRRAKIENEVRMRAVAQEMAYVESANSVWNKSILARKNFLLRSHDQIVEHRENVEFTARNKTIQVVLPAGQVEITTTGHMEDFEDAVLMLRDDIEKINNVILKVGEIKLKMMKKQMDFRKGIIAKEWEHAQVKMKLRHMEQELNSYQRLKIPKELQLYLKNKELGYTEEQDYVRLEKEMEASKVSVNKVLSEQVHRTEELELKINELEAASNSLNTMVDKLHVMVSEKRLKEDPLEPIRIRRVLKKRMENLVMRSKIIREVQANHTTVVLLQTELELLRLKTYPTLASFRTIC